MSRGLRRITCTVLARDLWIDHFLANNEPNCQVTTLTVDTGETSSVKRIQFGFCHRGWVEKIEQVDGYPRYQQFDTTKVGDQIVVEYLVLSTEPAVLAYMGGYTVGRGPVLELDNRGSGVWLSIENLTQGWVVDLRENED